MLEFIKDLNIKVDIVCKWLLGGGDILITAKKIHTENENFSLMYWRFQKGWVHKGFFHCPDFT